MRDILLPILTLLVGFALSSIKEWFQTKGAIRREREARQDARRDNLAQRRNEFQRDTLLKLQDAALQLIRNVASSHHHDVVTYRQTNQWGKHYLPEDLNENLRLAQANTSLLASRVRDQVVRDSIQALKSGALRVSMSKNYDEARSALEEIVALHDDLLNRIGEILRTLDEDYASVSERKV